MRECWLLVYRIVTNGSVETSDRNLTGKKIGNRPIFNTLNVSGYNLCMCVCTCMCTAICALCVCDFFLEGPNVCVYVAHDHLQYMSPIVL